MKALFIAALLAVPAAAQQINPNQIQPATANGYVLTTPTANQSASWQPVPSSTTQIQTFSTAPLAGQSVIVFPTSVATVCPATQANNTSGSVLETNGDCAPSVTWSFTAPSNIAIGNITAVYPFIIENGKITGGGNTVNLSCTGAGIGTPSITQSGIAPFMSVSFPGQQYTSSTSLSPITTGNFNAMQCAMTAGQTDPSVQPPNISSGTATLVGAYVYYTGTPVASPNNILVQYPLQYFSQSGTLSLALPYDYAPDTSGTANILSVTNGAYASITASGARLSVCAAHDTTSAAPTLNVNGWGAWPIETANGSTLHSGDIKACGDPAPLAQVVSGPGATGPVWYLSNPLTISGGGSGTVNSGTIGQVAYYASTGAAVSGENQVTSAQGGTGQNFSAGTGYLYFGAGAASLIPATQTVAETTSFNVVSNTYFNIACGSACTATLPASIPTLQFQALLFNRGSTNVTIANGGSSYDGVTTLVPCQQIAVYSDGTSFHSSFTTTYGSGLTFTPALSGCTLTASGGGGSLPTATAAGQSIRSITAGTTYDVEPSKVDWVSGDTIASINANSLCATACVYYLTGTVNVTASASLNAAVSVVALGGGNFNVSSAQTLTFNAPFNAPDFKQHFTGAGAVKFAPGPQVIYLEWFGAVGDCVVQPSVSCTTDNHVAWAAAAASMSNGNTLQLLAKGYGMGSTTVTWTSNNTSIVGVGAGRSSEGGTTSSPSFVTNSSASADFIDIGGVTPIQYDTFKGWGVESQIARTGNSAGISVTNCYGCTGDQLFSSGSQRPFYFTGTPAYGIGMWKNLHASWGFSDACYSSATTPYGFYVDGATDALSSMRGMQWTVSDACTTPKSTGLYLFDATDFSLDGIETAATNYGIQTSGAMSDTSVTEATLDQLQCSGILTNSVNGGSSLSTVGIGIKEIEGSGTTCPAIDLESSQGVSIYGASKGGRITGLWGLETGLINGGFGNSISGMTAAGGYAGGSGNCWKLNSTNSNVLANNKCTIAGGGFGVNLVSGTYNAISGNSFPNSTGGCTGLEADAASSHNHYLNTNTTACTTAISDAGTDNQSTQIYPGAGVPTSTGSAWGTSLTKFGTEVGSATSADPGTVAGIPMQSDGSHGIAPSGGTFTNTDYCTFATTTGLSCNTAATGGITLQNGGSSLGAITTLNCSTGTTCTAASGTGTITASGGGSGNYVNLCSTVALTNATCSSGTISITGGSSSVTISSIPGTDLNLILSLQGQNSSGGDQRVVIQFNADTGSNYDYAYTANGTPVQSAGQTSTTTAIDLAATSGTIAGGGTCTFPLYSAATFNKILTCMGSVISSGTYFVITSAGNWHSGANAITSMKLSLAGGANFVTGDSMTLYGTN